MKHKDSQTGNILFIILLAIVLFAAFTYAVTRTSGQGGSATPERDKLDATNIISYGNSLRNAVDNILGRGTSIDDLRFANDIVSGYGTVGANPSAEVFNIAGGGMTYETPDARWLDSTYSAQTNFGTWHFNIQNGIRRVGTPYSSICSAPGCTELAAYLPYIKKSICLKINDLVGLTNPSGNPPQDNNAVLMSEKFNGANSASQNSLYDSAGYIASHTTGCFEGDNNPPTGTYTYFITLVAR